MMIALELFELVVKTAEMEASSKNAEIAAAARGLLMLLLPVSGSIKSGTKSVERLNKVLIDFASSELLMLENGDENDF